MRTSARFRDGLSLVEILLVVVMVALVMLVVLPTLVPARRHYCRPTCTSYLKQVGLAFRLYSNDHDDKFPFAVSQASGGTMEFANSPQVFRHFQAMSNELVTPKLLVCPTDTNRQRAHDFFLNGPDSFNSNANLSYFVALDADEGKPQQLLSGDRNITGGMFTNGFLRLLQPTSKVGWGTDLHHNEGNIGLGDGSAMLISPNQLNRRWRTNTLSVIRLAIP